MGMANFGLLCIIAILVVFDYSNAATDKFPKLCKVPNGGAGYCKILTECKPLLSIYQNTKRSKPEELFIRQSVGACGSKGLKIKICCPPESLWGKLKIHPVIYPDTPFLKDANSTLSRKWNDAKPTFTTQKNTVSIINRSPRTHDTHSIKKQYCGRNAPTSYRMVGGSITEVDEYPWLALLEYNLGVVACGGSLISDRFVLTAAHCLRGTEGPFNVRLSEYNISSYPVDTVYTYGNGSESIEVQIVSIEWSRQHPGYIKNTYVNDIGLVKMSHTVTLTDFINIICLPSKNYLADFTEGVELLVAGWGSDAIGHRMSDVKRDLKMPFVPPAKCREAHNMREGRPFCAGGQRGKDICNGDSGGPLMYESSEAVIVGVVSYGNQPCGSEGKPAVFTYVYDYMEWIEKQMVGY